MTTKAPLPRFRTSDLDALGAIASARFTHADIRRVLADSGVPDVAPDESKARRVAYALAAVQESSGTGNPVAGFLLAAAEPGRWHDRPDAWTEWRRQLNTILVRHGLDMGDDGLIHRVAAAGTMTEAQMRADALATKLRQRGVHPDVLRHCQAEWVADDYHHAVLEACKALAVKIRGMTGLDLDASTLVRTAFDTKHPAGPYLLVNRYVDTNDHNDHAGVQLLLEGLFRIFRNGPAHVPRIHGAVTEQDALDLMVMASYLHRRLDRATRTGRPVP
jgi:uncharacterized protein (TIGR02391 family)